METYAIHKSAMVAPRKARMTMDLIRGKDISAARAILDTTNTKSSRLIRKVLESAVANAVNGPVTEDVPASILQKHKDVVFIVDEDAASKL